MPLVQPTNKFIADNFSGGVGAVTVNAATNFTAGSDLVITIAHFDGSSTPRVTAITAGGTAAVAEKKQNDPTSENYSEIWRATNIVGGTNVVTIDTSAGTGQYLTFGVDELDDISENGLDLTNSVAANTSATPSISYTTLNTPDQYVFATFTDYLGTNWGPVSTQSPSTLLWSETNGTIRQSGAAGYNITTTVNASLIQFTTNTPVGNIGVLTTYRKNLGSRALAYHFTGTTASFLNTPSFNSKPTNSFILVGVGRGVSSYFNTTAVVNDNKGNGNFPLIGTSHNYTAFPSSGTAMYGKLSAIGGSSHVVSTNKPDTADEVTLIVGEFPNISNIITSDWIERTTGPTNLSPTLSIDGPCVLVSIWWGTDSNGELFPAVPLDWSLMRHTSSLASNHVQSAMAYKRITTTGVQNHSILWTPSTSQGAQVYIIALKEIIQSSFIPSILPPWQGYYSKGNRRIGPNSNFSSKDSFANKVSNDFIWRGRAITITQNPIFFGGRV
jgi:hypothetical protein